MRTLFLGSYGFGNLGDELCLLEAMRAFPSTEAWAFSADPAHTASNVPGIAGFIHHRAEIKALQPQRVVLGGGGVGFFPSIRDMLHWMNDARRLGAECHIHNIGAALLGATDWAAAPEVKDVLANLASFSVRDHISWFCVRDWARAHSPNITLYPERLLPAEDTLLPMLPAGRRLLGISITGQASMRRALCHNADRVRAKLLPFQDHVVVPIISTNSASDTEEDDVAGFRHFRDSFLPNAELACAEFLDPAWWRQNMTALRLKGVIGGLDMLVTQRKHNLIHAIGMQTPCIGTYPSEDDSIARIFFSLRDMLPLAASQLSLTSTPD